MLKILVALGRLPEPFLYTLSSGIYFLLSRILRYRHQTIAQNLLIAFPDKSTEERKQIMCDFYRHLSEVIVEILMLASMDKKSLFRHVTLTGKEHLTQLAQNRQSFILMGAHQANWEWMFAALSCNCPCPLDALYRPVHHQAIDDFFRLIRGRFGSTMLAANDAPRAILRQRKATRAIAIIADQTPRRKDPKSWLTFMGARTAVVTGPDRIGQMTSYPILFVTCERIARGRYHCNIQPLTQPPYDNASQVAVAYMGAVEKQIRQQPAFWLWSHRRWRFSDDSNTCKPQ